MTTASPTVLNGRYVLGELLGTGGMARVFRARDTLLARDVAIKVFRQDDVVPDADARRSGEVRVLAGLNHPGLVMVFDAGRDDSDPLAPFAYLVMELVEGTTLARVLDDGPLAAPRTATIGAQLAGALAYVHARGVVHRDVKPANVVMGAPESGVAKLTDFGVARLLDSTRLTVHGTTVGTANYLSPEQAAGDDVGPASDVYSLALVLLECLTGAVAFPGHGVAAAVARLHRAPEVPQWLAPAWRELLLTMTAREPAARPPATDVAARLAALATSARSERDDTAPTQQVAAAVVPAAAPRVKHRPGRHLAWIAAGLAGAVTAATIALAGTSGTATPASAAVDTSGYPHVGGKLGRDLHTLETLAPSELRHGVATAARDSAERDYHGAQRALSGSLDALAGMQARGQVGDALNARIAAAIATAIARVSSDLMRAQLAQDVAARAAADKAERVRARAAARAARAAAARAAAAAARAAQQRAARTAAQAARAAAQRRAAREAAAVRAAAQAAQAAARHARAHQRAAGPARPGAAHGPARPPAPKPAHGPGHKPGHGPGHGDGPSGPDGD